MPIADAEESHPGLGQEARFAEAVIAYNKKQTNTSLQILDELIAVAPKTTEYLELKALILKGIGQSQKSYETYKQLYEVAAPKDRGPYAFEIASLLDKGGYKEKARPYFQKSIALGFNVAASYLYLGLQDYNTARFADAEKEFTQVANSGISDLEIIGRYYLGITYFKLNNGPQGIQEIVEVQKLAAKKQGSDLSKNIGDAADKMLQPFNQGQWFGNAALLTQYDSNVQQLPSGVINPSAGVNPSTMKINFSGGGGYMTAPLDTIQWVAGYRATYNYNFNTATKGFQYFTNNASLYMNYRTLARTSVGLKLDTYYTFQYSPTVATAPTTSPYEYQKYSFNLGGGPYFRHQLDRTWRLEAEAGYRNQTFYIDPNLSGKNMNARVSVRNDAALPVFNPGFSMAYENNSTNSDQFYYAAFGFGLNNTMNLGRQTTLSQSIDVLFSNYSKASPDRNDKNYSFKIAAAKVLNAKWALIADISYIINHSTVDATYSYNRFLTSFGLGYTF